MVEQSPSADADSRDAHFKLLCLIEQHPEYSQRRLAQALGVSLGKTHYLLKALFDKGLVKTDKFTRNPRKLSYLYALTPTGVTHRLQLTRRFLQRKETEFEMLKSEIAQLKAALDNAPSTNT